MRILIATLCCLGLIAWLPAQEPPTLSAAQQSAVQKILLKAAPEGAVSLAKLRADGAKPGDRVTVRAQVGGRNPPWLPTHAMMLLADAQELQACSTGGCGAPWDFCSAPPDKLLIHTGLVRWLDENGQQARPIPFPLIAGIAPLATVVVTGTLAEVGDPQALVIDLDGLYLEDQGPFAHLMRRAE